MMANKTARVLLCVLFSGCLAAAAGCAPATAPPGAPQADLKWPPVGSTFVMANRNSGSFGSDSGQASFKFLGEQVWQGRKLMAFSDGRGTNYSDSQRRLVAIVRGGTLTDSFDPYYPNVDWPLFVRKSWSNRFRFTDHRQGRTWDSQHDGKVEAYEDVKTPAGTFKAFRIGLGDQYFRVMSWYSPDLGLFVKTRTERLSGYYAGAGVRETELVSYDFKP